MHNHIIYLSILNFVFLFFVAAEDSWIKKDNGGDFSPLDHYTCMNADPGSASATL